MEVSEIQMECQRKIDEIEEKWKQKLLDIVEEKGSEIAAIESNWSGKEEKWQESKRSLESQVSNKDFAVED